MPKNTTMPAWLLLMIILIASGFGLLVGNKLPRFSTLSLNFDTNTVSNPCNAVPNAPGGFFGNSYGGGSYPLVPNQNHYISAPSGGGELMDSSIYWLSYQPGTQSQTIAVSGIIYSCQKFLTLPDQIGAVRFVVSETNDGLTWSSVHNPDIPNGVYQIPACGLSPTASVGAFTFHFYGGSFTDQNNATIQVLDGAAVRIQEFFAWSVDASSPGTSCASPNYNPQFAGPFATDYAVLRNALPGGYFSNTRNGVNLYEVNDTFAFNWNVPTTRSSTIAGQKSANYYTMTITSDALGNGAIAGWSQKELTSLTGQASFPITPSMFTSTFHTIHVEIDAALVTAYQTWVATLDNATKAPTLVSVTLNKAQYYQGDPITVTIVGKPNAITKAPLIKAEVQADINGKNVISTSQTIAASNANGTTTFVISGYTAPYAGILTVNAEVVDSVGRPSGYVPLQAFVGQPPPSLCSVYPNAPQCIGGGPGIPPSLTLAELALALLVIGVALFFVGRVPTMPRVIAVVLILLGVVLVAAGAFLGIPLVIQALTRAVAGLAPWG